jgi:hypothetical protein
MIASFLVLTLLGIGLVVFWIAWWLVADLFSGWAPAPPARIKASDEERRSSGSTRRTAISHQTGRHSTKWS